jgi:hypothetical protein
MTNTDAAAAAAAATPTAFEMEAMSKEDASVFYANRCSACFTGTRV